MLLQHLESENACYVKLTTRPSTIILAEEGETPDPANGTVSGDTITLQPGKDEDMPFDLVFKKKKT